MLKTIVDRYRNMPVASKAGLWFVVCSCIQSGIKFLSLPIFANMMSVAQYGNVTLYTSWMSVMFIFATLALGNANGVYYVAMVKFPSSRDQFTSCMQGLTVALCLVCFSVAGLSTCLLGDWMGIGVAQYPVMCIELMGYGFVLLWSLRLRYGNDYSSLLKITLAYSLSLVAAPVLGLIAFNGVANEALIKNLCGSIASFLVGCYAFAQAYKAGRRLYDRTYWAFAFKFNAVLVPHNLSGVILTQSDRIMIATLISEAAAAIYSVAYTLGVAVQVITQALINAINPWMYRKLESDHGKGISKVIVPLVAVVGVLIVCAVLIMPEIFTAFFPADYSQALYVIPPVAAGVLWAFIFNLYASIELYFMKNNLVSIASIGGAILNIVLNLIAIPIFGYMASAFATLICDIAYALFHTVFASKSLKHAGFGSNVLPVVPLWGTGIFVTVIVLAVMAIYPYRVIRCLIVVAAIIAAVIFRKNLIKLIKFKAE